MRDFILTIVAGLVVIGVGIANRRGNISMLHSYHRKNITEENRLPFGKTLGIGTIITGISIVIYGYLDYKQYGIISDIVIATGLVVGLGICFYAMFKYNKGIF